MDVIGGRLYSNHPKNLNHVNKDSKGSVSVIINLGGNISGGDTVFYDGVKTSDLGSRAHELQHLHGRMIFGPFDFFSTKVLFGEDIEPYFPLSSQKKFLYFCRHRDRFYNRYINTTDKKRFLDDDGTGVKPKCFTKMNEIHIWL